MDQPTPRAERIVLALQYFGGDREPALRLADTLAELEPQFNPTAVFLFVHAFDCEPPPASLVVKLREKFRTVVHKSTTKWMGYPDGCAAMWLDSIDWARAAKQNGETSADCMLTFEADCSPLVPDWIARLVETFDRENPVSVMGDHHPFTAKGRPRGEGHINGNLVVSLKSSAVLDQIAAYRTEHRKKDPWDVIIYPKFASLGVKNVGEIQSDYKSQSLSPAYLTGLARAGVIFHHGCKDESVRDWVSGRGSKIPPYEPPNPKEGLFYYSDTKPSVFQQGFVGGLVEFDQPLFEGKTLFARKNGSHVNCDGTDWLAFRLQKSVPELAATTDRWEEPAEVWMSKLDRKTNKAQIVGPVQGLARWDQPGWQDGYGDPRLFLFQGRPHLAYSHLAYNPKGEVIATNQRLVALGRDMVSVLRDVSLPHGKNFAKAGLHEKNWAFFEDHGKLRFVYSTHPTHTVVEVGTGRAWKSTPFGGAEKWSRAWGDPRGGTMPVKVGGSWLSLFHSHREEPIIRRRYHVGAVCFSSEHASFQATQFSKRPLFTGSLNDGLAWMLGSSVGFSPQVLFPGSAELTEDGKALFVVSGLNEHSVAWHQVPLEKLFASFKRE
jgi:hypothetical protein